MACSIISEWVVCGGLICRSVGTDTDGDGCTDAEDDDDDGDGVGDLDDLCREESGPAANHGCPYVCGLDEAGGGQEPYTPCGVGEVPNVEGTACVVCEHGESSILGTCRADPCYGVSCSTNEVCVLGNCECMAGYEDPDEDGVCTTKCPEGTQDPDGEGLCSRVCTYREVDAVAKPSLKSIPSEPWERSEPYYCRRSGIAAGTRRDNESAYDNRQDVCLWDVSHDTHQLEAVGHSHPHFEWDSDKTVEENTVRCGHRILDSETDMIVENLSRGNRFSFSDRSYAKNLEKPLYLVVAERNFVKVYRHPENCSTCDWEVVNL